MTSSSPRPADQHVKAYFQHFKRKAAHAHRYALPKELVHMDPHQREGVFADFPLPEELPSTESLKDCVARTLPYW